jgi:hypothetical protein
LSMPLGCGRLAASMPCDSRSRRFNRSSTCPLGAAPMFAASPVLTRLKRSDNHRFLVTEDAARQAAPVVATVPHAHPRRFDHRHRPFAHPPARSGPASLCGHARLCEHLRDGLCRGEAPFHGSHGRDPRLSAQDLAVQPARWCCDSHRRVSQLRPAHLHTVRAWAAFGQGACPR